MSRQREVSVEIDPPPPGPTPTPAPTVTARDVLQALSEVRRRGHWPLFQQLEQLEPDLAEFVLEEISAIHHTLLKSGARPRVVRRLQRQVQSLILVSLRAIQPTVLSRGD